MTATILLIRHAAHAHLGHTLSGRTAGGPLTQEGTVQARDMAARLASEPIAEVHTSPVLRARETANCVSAGRPGEPIVAPALDEVDFGLWSGRRFAELDGDPLWHRWNNNRAEARAPEGETMQQVQQRSSDYLATVARRAAGRVIAFVTHCDVIRAMVAGILGLSLDRILQFEISPASVSRVEAGDWGARVLSLNEYAA